MIKRIKRVWTRVREKEINDIKKLCVLPVNSSVKEGLAKRGCAYILTDISYPTAQMNGAHVVDLKGINEEVYILLSDGRLFYCNQEDSVLLDENIVSGSLCVFEVRIGNQSLSACACGGKIIFSNLDEISGVPNYNTVAFHKGRFFFAENSRLYICGLYDMENRTSNLNMTSTIDFDGKSGKIIGLISQNESLFVVCERSVYKLKTSSEISDYTLDKVNFDLLNVNELSFANGDGFCVYLDGKNLMRFDGVNYAKADGLLDNLDVVNYSRASVENDVYYMPITLSNGDKYIYHYDFKTNSEGLSDFLSDYCFGNYAIYDGGIYKLGDNVGYVNNSRLIINGIDFDSLEEKTLCGLEVYLDGDCVLKVRGDFGEKTYRLKGGENFIRLNHKSHAFSIEFSNNGGFSIKKLKLKYRLKGE